MSFCWVGDTIEVNPITVMRDAINKEKNEMTALEEARHGMEDLNLIVMYEHVDPVDNLLEELTEVDENKDEGEEN